MKSKHFIIILSITTLAFYACGNKKTESESSNKKAEIIKQVSEKPLNISIYLDLSDRLTRDMTPSQKDRDLAIVEYIADYFKKQTLGPKILHSKNRLKILFYPTPNSSDIATLASELSVDMTKYEGKDKRIALEGMKDKFTQNLSSIYDKTLKDNNWPGCDIWDFFSNKQVDRLCIDKEFRNVLIILTDGYLFDDKHRVQEGNAYSYVTPSTLKNPNSTLIVRRNGLENLEVRVLEINPIDKNHRDQLVNVLEKWLSEMGVRREKMTVSETDLPSNTQTIIESFLN